MSKTEQLLNEHSVRVHPKRAPTDFLQQLPPLSFSLQSLFTHLRISRHNFLLTGLPEGEPEHLASVPPLTAES